MAPFVKQFLRLDGNFLQKRRKAPPQTPDRRCRNARQSPSGQPTSVRRLPLVKSGILCPGKMSGRYARRAERRKAVMAPLTACHSAWISRCIGLLSCNRVA